MKLAGKGRPVTVDHKEFETYLGRYSGLMLYLKEMDESIYGRLCAASHTTCRWLIRPYSYSGHTRHTFLRQASYIISK